MLYFILAIIIEENNLIPHLRSAFLPLNLCIYKRRYPEKSKKKIVTSDNFFKNNKGLENFPHYFQTPSSCLTHIN